MKGRRSAIIFFLVEDVLFYRLTFQIESDGCERAKKKRKKKRINIKRTVFLYAYVGEGAAISQRVFIIPFASASYHFLLRRLS